MGKLALLGATALLAIPASAMAEDGAAPTPKDSAVKQCRTERTQMGEATFRATYGTNRNGRNAFGKCVSSRNRKNEAADQKAQDNAAKQCKTEQTADPAAFTTKYGTDPKGHNAHGKCVSGKAKDQAKADETRETKDEVSASKSCKTERKADADAFAKKYGTNGNHRNAFGKCVSGQAKKMEQESTQGS